MVIQNREQQHPGTYVGKGKIEELKSMIWELRATGIVCDDELSPAQMKNLQDELDVKVMDRTLIILDIFAARASTSEGKIQVELAQLARENDAMVIALTTAGTPLAREATLAITLDVPEDTDIYMPMVSRLAQLTVIDVLATGFTLRRGAKFRDNLKRVKEALKESRFDKELLIKSDVP